MVRTSYWLNFRAKSKNWTGQRKHSIHFTGQAVKNMKPQPKAWEWQANAAKVCRRWREWWRSWDSASHKPAIQHATYQVSRIVIISIWYPHLWGVMCSGVCSCSFCFSWYK